MKNSYFTEVTYTFVCLHPAALMGPNMQADSIGMVYLEPIYIQRLNLYITQSHTDFQDRALEFIIITFRSSYSDADIRSYYEDIHSRSIHCPWPHIIIIAPKQVIIELLKIMDGYQVGYFSKKKEDEKVKPYEIYFDSTGTPKTVLRTENPIFVSN